MGRCFGSWLASRRSSGTSSCGDRRAIVEVMEPRRLLSGTVHYTTKFADGNFASANWRIITVNVGTGGTQTATRAAKGGHPGAYRIVSDTVFTQGLGVGSVIYGFNAYKKALYNPAKKGAITSINYSEDSLLIAGFGQGEATGAAVLQNGVVYFDAGLVTPNRSWTHQAQSNLTAANFTASDQKSHPDFSQTGAPLQFGFYRANSAGSQYSITAAIDNFSLTIKSTKTAK
jgi:hypothetical protein